METAFGLDLAGFSTCKSGFARADKINKSLIKATVYKNHTFKKIHEGDNVLADVLKGDIEFIESILKYGNLYVDVPIDVQGLHSPDHSTYMWQLVKRNVDKAFGGISPLADRIGHCVARFSNLLAKLEKQNGLMLGKSIFETYPAASLGLLGYSLTYKRQIANYDETGWSGGKGLAKLLNTLQITAKLGTKINDDDFDAVICAITGVIGDKNTLLGDKLQLEIQNRLQLANVPTLPPQGYVLTKRIPDNIQIKLLVEQDCPYDKI